MNRAYKIVMSRGDDLPVDGDELPNVLAGIQAGLPVKVRSGIFNPSFYVSIVEDKERRAKFLDDMRHEHKYSPRLLAGMQPLKDIFAETPIARLVAQDKKLLT